MSRPVHVLCRSHGFACNRRTSYKQLPVMPDRIAAGVRPFNGLGSGHAPLIRIEQTMERGWQVAL
ncbi:hypothetical protein CHELA40_11837 [Chelatococcus asaccharovorans]|nr:hypothetical protein CHELA40_11837 [Chelatococcus asaccharovorans]